MHKGKKTIRIRTLSPHAVYRDYRSPWDDVWIDFKMRRRRVHFGPCIESSGNLMVAIDCAERSLEVMRELDHRASSIAEQEEYVDELRAIARHFADGGEFFVHDVHEPGCPDIYVRGEYLTRERIERALELFLRERGYLKGTVRFNWVRPSILACAQ